MLRKIMSRLEVDDKTKISPKLANDFMIIIYLIGFFLLLIISIPLLLLLFLLLFVDDLKIKINQYVKFIKNKRRLKI